MSADSVPSKGSEGESVPCLFPPTVDLLAILCICCLYRCISPISALIFLCDIESKAWTLTHQITVVLFSAIRKNSKRASHSSPIPHLPAILAHGNESHRVMCRKIAVIRLQIFGTDILTLMKKSMHSADHSDNRFPDPAHSHICT